MSISQEGYETLVKTAAANRHKVVKVAVSGFGFVLTLKSRRARYDVSAFYDAATDSWTGVDPYSGGTLSAMIPEIAQAMKK